MYLYINMILEISAVKSLALENASIVLLCSIYAAVSAITLNKLS